MTEQMTFHLDLERWADFELNCLAPYFIFINSISVMEYENVLTGNLNNVITNVGNEIGEKLWEKHFQNNYQCGDEWYNKVYCVFLKDKNFTL